MNNGDDDEDEAIDPVDAENDDSEDGEFDPDAEADEAARQYLDEDDDEYSPLGADIFREMTGMEIDDEEGEDENGESGEAE